MNEVVRAGNKRPMERTMWYMMGIIGYVCVGVQHVGGTFVKWSNPEMVTELTNCFSCVPNYV